jgi:hypothetical protein
MPDQTPPNRLQMWHVLAIFVLIIGFTFFAASKIHGCSRAVPTSENIESPAAPAPTNPSPHLAPAPAPATPESPAEVELYSDFFPLPLTKDGPAPIFVVVAYKCDSPEGIVAALAKQHLRLASAKEMVSFTVNLLGVLPTDTHVIGRGLLYKPGEDSYLGAASHQGKIIGRGGTCMQASEGKPAFFLATSNHRAPFDGLWGFQDVAGEGATVTLHVVADTEIVGEIEAYAKDDKVRNSAWIKGKLENETATLTMYCGKEDGQQPSERQVTLERDGDNLKWTTKSGADFPCKADVPFPKSFTLLPQ